MAAAALAFADGEIRVDEAQFRSHIKSHVDPVYPPIAKQMKVAGKVTLDAYVDTDGSVDKVEPTSGNPLLTRSGADAVKKWKFSTFTKDGKPVRAIVPVSLEFRP